MYSVKDIPPAPEELKRPWPPGAPKQTMANLFKGNVFKGKKEYEDGLKDAKTGKYNCPSYRTGSLISIHQRGLYLQGWIDGGGSIDAIRPTEWIQALNIKQFTHSNKIPYFTEEEIMRMPDENDVDAALSLNQMLHGMSEDEAIEIISKRKLN